MSYTHLCSQQEDTYQFGSCLWHHHQARIDFKAGTTNGEDYKALGGGQLYTMFFLLLIDTVYTLIV